MLLKKFYIDAKMVRLETCQSKFHKLLNKHFATYELELHLVISFEI